MYSQSQINQIVKNAIANGLLDNVDVNAKSLSADSIIENMSGYSMSVDSDHVEMLYAGIVKNGNKLTLTMFGGYTYETGDIAFKVATITVPNDIWLKLVPYTQAGENRMIDQRTISIFADRQYAKTLITDMQRVTNNQLIFNFLSVNNAGLTNGVKYLFRFEATFLLSENLAPQASKE